jgi:elongation factor Ts
VEITAGQIKQLRDATGAGVLDSRNALQQSHGDFEKAVAYLREKGLAGAAKKSGRSASDGVIGSYVHHNKRVGVLVELNTETDFVARTDQFQALAQDLALHIAMANPLYLTPADVPADVVEAQRAAFRKEAEATGKPAAVIDRIVEGKLEKYYSEVCLMRQPFVKEDSVRIDEMIKQAISALGENIVVRRFSRFELGGE